MSNKNLALIKADTRRSPFEALKQTDEYGEFWSARDLQKPGGYGDKWQNFEKAIERAMAACENSGHDIEDHFTGASKKVRIGSGATRKVNDYLLSRYGAYLVFMNGDPRKPEIAAAQTYFATRTRQAELAEEVVQQQPQWRIPQTFAEAMQLAAEQAKQLEESAPKVEYHDEVLRSRDAMPVTVIAKEFGLTAQALNSILHKEKIQFKVGETWVLYDKYARMGLVDSDTFAYEHTDGTGGSKRTTKWTEKGRLFIHELLTSQGYERVNAPRRALSA